MIDWSMLSPRAEVAEIASWRGVVETSTEAETLVKFPAPMSSDDLIVTLAPSARFPVFATFSRLTRDGLEIAAWAANGARVPVPVHVTVAVRG